MLNQKHLLSLLIKSSHGWITSTKTTIPITRNRNIITNKRINLFNNKFNYYYTSTTGTKSSGTVINLTNNKNNNNIDNGNSSATVINMVRNNKVDNKKKVIKKEINNDKKKNKKQKKYQRVDRILSNRGVGSRTEVTRLLKQKGRVCIQVTNDKSNNTDDNDNKEKVLIPIKSPSEKIPINSIIIIDNKIDIPALPLLKIFNKPKHVLSSMNGTHYDAKHNITNLGDYLPYEYHNLLHPVGRLDLDSSGLLLFSSVGLLTQRLLHPKYVIEKEYIATVEVDSIKSTSCDKDGVIDKDKLSQILENGVSTTEGMHKAKLINVTPLAQNDNDDNNESSSDSSMNNNHYNIQLVVTEGKHRMVRRMLANIGYPVIELCRIRLGNITLNNDEIIVHENGKVTAPVVPPGEFRDLYDNELEWITTNVLKSN